MTFNSDIDLKNLLASSNQIHDLSNTVSLVTAGTSWLGLPMSIVLASHGSTVYVTSTKSSCFHSYRHFAESNKLDMRFQTCDLRDHESLSSLINLISRNHGKLNILVNNAAGGGGSERGLNSTVESFDASYNINISGLWRLIQLSIPLLKKGSFEDGDSSIINISSMYGKVSPYPSVYESSDQPPNPPLLWCN